MLAATAAAETKPIASASVVFARDWSDVTSGFSPMGQWPPGQSLFTDETALSWSSRKASDPAPSAPPDTSATIPHVRREEDGVGEEGAEGAAIGAEGDGTSFA